MAAAKANVQVPEVVGAKIGVPTDQETHLAAGQLLANPMHRRGVLGGAVEMSTILEVGVIALANVHADDHLTTAAGFADHRFDTSLMLRQDAVEIPNRVGMGLHQRAGGELPTAH